MKPTITKADTAGWRLTLPNDIDTYYVGEYYEQGTIYKDREAFDSHEGVCYIPESGFFDAVGWDENIPDDFEQMLKENNLPDGWVFCDYRYNDGAYTRDDIYAAVYAHFNQDGWVDEMKKEYGNAFVEAFIDQEAEYVFETVDWQCPETLLNEMDWEEDWENYLERELDDKRLTPKLRKELGYE